MTNDMLGIVDPGNWKFVRDGIDPAADYLTLVHAGMCSGA